MDEQPKSPKSPDTPIAEGEVLDGKYKIERVLGQGGMGVVVAATHLSLRQKVAIKFLLPGAGKEVTARFLREARSAARLRSDHVTRVLDVAELPTGAPYMVMEYLDGSDLSRVLRKRGAFPIVDAVDFVLQACEAIAEAHTLGIIHRDLKPANLFLTKAADGSATVKVLDFGISKDTGDSDGTDGDHPLTATKAMLGSPNFMAPEQMRSSRDVDARADIWSLGAILYQLLTKVVPFKAPSFVDLVIKVTTEDPAPPSTLREDLPPDLEAAVLRCLKRNINERFTNVAELAAAIAPFGRSEAMVSAQRIARMQGAPIPAAPIERHSAIDVPAPLSMSAGASGSTSGPRATSGLLSSLPVAPSASIPPPSIPPPSMGPASVTGKDAAYAATVSPGDTLGASAVPVPKKRIPVTVLVGAILGALIAGIGAAALSRNRSTADARTGPTSAAVAESAPALPAPATPGPATAEPVAQVQAPQTPSALPKPGPAITPATPLPSSPSARPSAQPSAVPVAVPPPASTPATPPATPPPAVTPPPATPPPTAPPPTKQPPPPKKNPLDIDIQ
ncbi:MAG: serine/threonine-protein kinase [Byssovorax sp.]